MATDCSDDVRAFRDFLDERLSHGASSFTLDEALRLWEIQGRRPATEREDNDQDRREGIDDLRAGDTDVPSRRFRARPCRKLDRSGRLGVRASSSLSAEISSEVQPSSSVFRQSRWLD
jgi:hypothetical protein